MTDEEILALATKVRDGKATPEEVQALLLAFKKKTADLNKYLDSLPTKDTSNNTDHA